MGFGADVSSARSKPLGELFEQVQPEDLLQYGLIPEFVGRLPVTATLHELDEEAMLNILNEPKNALTRQYKRLFDMDGVKLTFTESSLRQVARKALERKTGARGLRAILESVMLDVMYDVPSDPNIREVVVSDECVTENKRPMLVYEAKAESA